MVQVVKCVQAAPVATALRTATGSWQAGAAVAERCGFRDAVHWQTRLAEREAELAEARDALQSAQRERASARPLPEHLP